MDRAPGLSVRLKLTFNYAGFLMLAGALLLAAVWVFLLRDLPDIAVIPRGVLNRSVLLRTFASAAGAVLVFLLVFGLLGGVASRPYARPPDPHHRRHTHGCDRSLSHRIELEGRRDEFRELADAFDTMLARLEAHVAEQQNSQPTPP